MQSFTVLNLHRSSLIHLFHLFGPFSTQVTSLRQNRNSKQVRFPISFLSNSSITNNRGSCTMIFEFLIKIYTKNGTVVARWQSVGLQIKMSSDRSCTWGMIHTKIHLISPGYQVALQSRIGHCDINILSVNIFLGSLELS